MRVFDSRKFLAVGALVLVATLAVNGASPKDTAVVKDVVFNNNGQSLEVKITATEASKFTYFELSSPRRLVVDFHGSQSNIAFKEKNLERGGVERVRTSSFEDKGRKATRIVFDLVGGVPYRVVDDGRGQIRVVFGEVRTEAPPNLVAGPPVAPRLRPNESTLERLALNLASLQEAAPVSTVSLPPVVGEPVAVPQIAPPQPPQQGPPAITAPPQPQQYTGEIITLDLRDFDLRDFFRLIGDISGLNIVLDPNVAGTITILLRDVPWDQALDVVLRNYQLGGQLQGNVLRIATNATIESEENARKSLRDAQDLAAVLSTRTYVLNYTKADAVAATLQRMLSARGTIIQDARRNALIVSDLPSQFGRVDQLVQFLDTPAQQVEIEARLLQANKSFSKELGNQLGFIFGNNSGNVLTGGTGVSSPFSRTPPPRVTTGGSALPLAVNLPAAATSGIAFLMQPGGDILLDEIITASEARGTAKLISRPKVMAQNNQTAIVSQGTQIPVQTNVNNTISTQFLNFSLQLSVTPQITEAGTILLTVVIENSTPDFARAVNGTPSISTQRAQTQVLIQDGGTAVIGGILVDTDSLTIRQVPGLGSIPVLGYLFKSEQTLKSTSELLFFVTSRIKPPDSLDILAPGEGQATP